jgi:hypothetical protein
MSKAICYDNWYNQPNKLTHGFNLGIKPIKIKSIDIKLFQDKKRYKQIYQDIHYNDIKGILKDVIRINFNGEYQEYIPNEEFSEENLIFMLNYRTQYLFDVINIYDKHISNHENKHKILSEVFKLTHSINTQLSKEKMNAWIENFPNMIDRKIEILKKKNKKKNRSPKQIAYDKGFNNRPSEMRKLNIIRHMNSIGYHGFNEDGIWGMMKNGNKDDEIYVDLIKQFNDGFGNDHDLITYDDSKLMKDPKEDYYLEKEKEQFIDYLIKNNINWRVTWN